MHLLARFPHHMTRTFEPNLPLFSQHGRIAMLAICGLIVPEFVRVPGDIYQSVSVLDAHNAMVSPPPPLLFFNPNSPSLVVVVEFLCCSLHVYEQLRLRIILTSKYSGVLVLQLLCCRPLFEKKSPLFPFRPSFIMHLF